MTDALQILLSYGFLGCLALALALFQAGRVMIAVADVMRLLWRYIVPVWKLGTAVRLVSLACLLWALSAPITLAIEWAEFALISPVRLSDASKMDDGRALAMCEARIRQHCDEYEYGVVIKRTAEIAEKINSHPQAIYEAALLECGLNPFRVRDDGVAAGWIQFTRAGLSGLGVSLPEVIAACKRHDVNLIMDLTERYLVRKWEQAGRPNMTNTIDLYLAVFAPAHIGAQPEKVVYAGFGNPAYSLNSGLDGWYVDSAGRIIRSARLCDGRITVWEIFLALQKKKAELLRI
jgi:hypothetical protein